MLLNLLRGIRGRKKQKAAEGGGRNYMDWGVEIKSKGIAKGNTIANKSTRWKGNIGERKEELKEE